jgi:hypothetical protein
VAMTTRSWRRRGGVVGGPGGDLLSHVLGRSTMGAAGFHGRVRNGVGWGTRAVATRSSNHPAPSAAAARASRAAGGAAAPGRGREGSSWPASRHGGFSGSLRLSLMGVEVGRAIRTGQLHASPRVHTRPIDVVVYHGSDGETWF